MRVYAPETNKGRHLAGHDIHHLTGDSGLGWRKAKAKVQRKAARREAQADIAAAQAVMLREIEEEQHGRTHRWAQV